jgi:hypothetical protein
MKTVFKIPPNRSIRLLIFDILWIGHPYYMISRQCARASGPNYFTACTARQSPDRMEFRPVTDRPGGNPGK